VAIRRGRGLGSDGHFSNRVLHGSRLDDRVVPVGVGDEHDAPVLLLVGGARLPLLGCLGLALQAEPLFLAAARQLGLGDLGHGGPAHARGLAVWAPRGGGELLLLELGEAAVLGAAGGRLGALLGVLLAAARRARLGALRRLPVGLLLGTRLPVAALRLRLRRAAPPPP